MSQWVDMRKPPGVRRLWAGLIWWMLQEDDGV